MPNYVCPDRGASVIVPPSARAKQLIKCWVPPIMLAFARKVLTPAPPPIKHEGIQEIECWGLRWRLDMASIISRTMVETHAWEPDTTNVILDFVKPGMHVLSVGANFGYFALLMAQ